MVAFENCNKNWPVPVGITGFFKNSRIFVPATTGLPKSIHLPIPAPLISSGRLPLSTRT